MTTKRKPATPLEFVVKFPRYVYRDHRGRESVQWREAALNMYDDRARLVEALRKVGTPSRLTTAQRRALLHSLGEEV